MNVYQEIFSKDFTLPVPAFPVDTVIVFDVSVSDEKNWGTSYPMLVLRTDYVLQPSLHPSGTGKTTLVTSYRLMNVESGGGITMSGSQLRRRNARVVTTP